MKKDLIWLHIGMHKTGSTAIQDGLKTYDDGVTRYARLGIANHSALLSNLFDQRPAQKAKFAPGGRLLSRLFTPLQRRRLMAELTGPAPRLILSAETVSHFDKGAMTALAKVLMSHAAQVRVLVYVRDPVSYASSAFQQRVQGGNSSMKLTSPSFRKRLKICFDVFGRDAVDVAAYDRQAFGENGVLADAARRMGITSVPNEIAVVNQSLSAGATGLLYFWNPTRPQQSASRRDVEARRKLVAELAKALPGKFRLAPSLAQTLIDPADLDWLLRQTGIDFRACLTLPDAAGSDIFGEDDLAAAGEAALPALIDHMNALGIKNIPSDPNGVMNHLFAHIRARTSRMTPYLRLMTRSVS